MTIKNSFWIRLNIGKELILTMEITSNSSLEETLNAFIADEHIASVQYKMARVVAKGKALHFADKIFDENGDEEDEHFDEIVTYAQSLNIPVQVNPSQMETNCTTPFVDMTDGDSTAQIVSILISAEKKAINGYETALRNEGIIREHPELTQFFGELLNDERGHLKELEDVLSTIDGDSGVEVKIEPEIVDVSPQTQTDEYGYELENPEQQYNYGESCERPITANLVENIRDGKVDSEKIVRNLLNYLTEDAISEFADEYNYFDSKTAKLTSMCEGSECSNTFLEMVEDGMIEPKILAADILDSMNESEVKEFASDLGYIHSDCEKGANVPMNEIVIGESSFSFQNIFKKVVSR